MRACTQTPRRFRYGILAAYMFGNWGDLPTSVVQSVMASAPFNGEEDETLGVAFVSIFILVNYISSFPLQGLRLVQVDYESPVDAETELRHEDGEFGTVRKYWSRLIRGRPMPHELEEERERRLCVEERMDGGKAKEAAAEEEGARLPPPKNLTKRPRMVTAATQTVTAADDEDAILIAAPGLQPGHHLRSNDFPLLEPVPSDFGARSTASHSHSRTRGVDAQALEAETTSGTSYHPRASVRVWRSVWSLLRPILTSPPTMVLVSALIISLIPTLRALFVAPEPGTSFHPTAPDGKPPLAVLYDTATFVGGASVPTGLIVLGASIAKIKVPRPISRLPLSGIVGMAIVRMAIMPIVGFFFVKQLVNVGMVEANNRVLRFGTYARARSHRLRRTDRFSCSHGTLQLRANGYPANDVPARLCSAWAGIKCGSPGGIPPYAVPYLGFLLRLAHGIFPSCARFLNEAHKTSRDTPYTFVDFSEIDVFLDLVHGSAKFASFVSVYCSLNST